MHTMKHFEQRSLLFSLLSLAFCLALMPAAQAQVRPYVGYVYPAGGQQGTTFQIRLGGQNLEGVHAALVSGPGVSTKVIEYLRRLNNQETQLLSEQLRDLKRATSSVASTMTPMMSSQDTMMMSAATTEKTTSAPAKDPATQSLIARIEKRNREFVQTPACASLASLVIVEVTVAPDAAPGAREIRLATTRGVSNPLVFHVGQLPESSRNPMLTATIQVLGKEAQALRKRPTAEAEERITLPCTVNGQIASGEVNRYRFTALANQRLVLSVQARRLIPYIADAVPGWFQPVLVLYDASGKEVAFADDYRFQPDPVLFYEVPKDGEYVAAIYDSIYRGREDFVYRLSLGELPFVTSIFPLGGQVGIAANIQMQGWNLDEAEITPPPTDAGPGVQSLAANRKGFISNRVPFALDTLPESFDKEPNNAPAQAQKVTLPTMVNGRIDRPNDWDVFRFTGKSNATITAEVFARRLDSPLDSVLKLTDAAGKLLAFSDDREDLAAGVNTHHADAGLMAVLPADGTYFVHLGDTARKGGEEYGYRLRLGAPQPDFALRVVPSSASLRAKSTATVSVHVMRKDGFTGPIKLTLKDPPSGCSATPVTLSGTQTVARLTFKCDRAGKEPIHLTIAGSAKIGDTEITRAAVPAEDRMQAFLWRHLVPASDFEVLVYDPADDPPPQRPAPVIQLSAQRTNAPAGTNSATAAKPKFARNQIAGRLRQLKQLYEEGLLTTVFYTEKVAECETAP